MPDQAVDRADQELQEQIVTLRSTSREFVSLLQTLKLPAPVLTQLQKFLDNVMAYPGQVVDLLMSTVETTIEEKISILDAVDLKERITKAVELLMRQIHVSIMTLGWTCRQEIGFSRFTQACVNAIGMYQHYQIGIESLAKGS